jgi:uncharacterized protein YjbJ (UPF0337 family)
MPILELRCVGMAMSVAGKRTSQIHGSPQRLEGKLMSERTFDSLGENVQGQIQEAAGKMTGDDELEAEGKRLRTEAEGGDQDETETYSFPPE